MNCHELWKLREEGFAGVKRKGSNFWTRRNCPVTRTCSSGPSCVACMEQPCYDAAGIFKAPALISSEESLRESVCAKSTQMYSEQKIDLGHVNKVFASSWLDCDRIVMGTKCNRLLVADFKSSAFARSADRNRGGRKRDRDGNVIPNRGVSLTHIPSLISSEQSLWQRPDDGMHSGIHAVKINPAGDMIATGAENPSDVAVYSLPDFRPICVGERAHTDWVFDLEWLDDEYVLSGSRDSVLGLFRFRDHTQQDTPTCSHVPWIRPPPPARGPSHFTPTSQSYPAITPVETLKMRNFEKIRALSFARSQGTAAAVSLNSRLALVDVGTMQQVNFKCLDEAEYTESVCLCHGALDSALVVGSRNYFTFFDSRNLKNVHKVRRPTNDRRRPLYTSFMPSGVRSISWSGPIVTIGTGGGEIMFFDVRNHQFVRCSGYSCGEELILKTGNGWQLGDETSRDMFHNPSECPTAIYTHCYDPQGTRLFTAGGPIAAAITGNYAGLWL